MSTKPGISTVSVENGMYIDQKAHALKTNYSMATWMSFQNLSKILILTALYFKERFYFIEKEYLKV